MQNRLKIIGTFLASILAMSNASGLVLCDGSGYKITKSNPTPIYIIDPNAASPTASNFISSVNITTTAFAYSLTHGLFFAVDGSDNQNLKTIDENGNTNLVTVTGMPADIRLGNVAMDVSYDGFLYVRYQGFDGTDWLNDGTKIIKLQLATSGTSATYIDTLDLVYLQVQI